MNILHINQSDISGGAAIAGYRLHQELLAQGIDSKILVGTSKTDSDFIADIPRRQTVDKILNRITSNLGFNYISLLSSFGIPRHQFYQDADILNFHNLHTGYFNYLAIPKLTENKPTIYTLHDMWSFTGHCAYSYDCSKWKTGCGKCPYPDTYPSISFDNTHLEWKLKKWIYSKSSLFIVSPSTWLTEQAKASMLGQFPIYHIANGIDTSLYQPLDRSLCRVSLALPQDKRVILFGAETLKDGRKGGDLLINALERLPSSLKAEIVLVTFGFGAKPVSSIPTVNLGYISSDRLKSLVYSAADLFIFPTRADNLPLVLQESMACGTPMVSFNVGGVPDLVRHMITGYLAKSEDIEDFGNGIVTLLEDQNLRDQMSERCRDIAVKEYNLTMQTRQYVELYQKILNSSASN
ncbi:MAG: glycosyltransferase family 4 protein [Pseudanabaenaceae cyanobacterium bins.68]|nr:glycosyltransferase family 4 protein [Pseudanabaenaceae cyanobacterium bins.68]